MPILIQCLAVAAGGALGAVARFLVTGACARLFGSGFPIGTLVVNLTGSVVFGWFVAVARDRTMVPETMSLAVAVGFIGAYTTFSTFAFESHSLLEAGSGLKALLNMVGSVVLGLLAVRAGILLAGR